MCTRSSLRSSCFFFFSSRRRHTRFDCDWSSDVCSSDLEAVDLTLERGITGLLGPNGAGKTTLLSILATVNEPDAGQVSVFGLDPRQAAERVEIRRRLGYLPQELGYHRHFTVAAFLDYLAILKEISGLRRRADEVAP